MKHRMIVTYFLVLEKFSSSIIFLLLTMRLSVLKSRGIRMDENMVITMTLLKLVLKFQIDSKLPMANAVFCKGRGHPEAVDQAAANVKRLGHQSKDFDIRDA